MGQNTVAVFQPVSYTHLPSSIRLINADDYEIDSVLALSGFLMGLCASDYDLTDVFVDSALDLFVDNKDEINDCLLYTSRCV